MSEVGSASVSEKTPQHQPSRLDRRLHFRRQPRLHQERIGHQQRTSTPKLRQHRGHFRQGPTANFQQRRNAYISDHQVLQSGGKLVLQRVGRHALRCGTDIALGRVSYRLVSTVKPTPFYTAKITSPHARGSTQPWLTSATFKTKSTATVCAGVLPTLPVDFASLEQRAAGRHAAFRACLRPGWMRR